MLLKTKRPMYLFFKYENIQYTIFVLLMNVGKRV